MSQFPEIQVGYEVKQPLPLDARKLQGSLQLDIPEGLQVHDLLIQFQSFPKDSPDESPVVLGQQRIHLPNKQQESTITVPFDFKIKEIVVPMGEVWEENG